MDAAETAEHLARIEFFKGCTQEQVGDIARLVQDWDLQPGDVLCRQGESGTDAFVVVRGRASVSIDGRDLGVVGPGEVVGELSAERGGVRTATLTAITPLRVLVVDPETIDSVLASDPESARRLGPRRPGDEFYRERRV